jgi:hypothetical protein
MNQDRDLTLIHQQEMLDKAEHLRLVSLATHVRRPYTRSWMASIGHWMITRGRALLARAGETDDLPPSDWTYNPT